MKGPNISSLSTSKSNINLKEIDIYDIKPNNENDKTNNSISNKDLNL